jgi:hypothetical protein
VIDNKLKGLTLTCLSKPDNKGRKGESRPSTCPKSGEQGGKLSLKKARRGENAIEQRRCRGFRRGRPVQDLAEKQGLETGSDGRASKGLKPLAESAGSAAAPRPLRAEPRALLRRWLKEPLPSRLRLRGNKPKPVQLD